MRLDRHTQRPGILFKGRAPAFDLPLVRVSEVYSEISRTDRNRVSMCSGGFVAKAETSRCGGLDTARKSDQESLVDPGNLSRQCTEIDDAWRTESG